MSVKRQGLFSKLLSVAFKPFRSRDLIGTDKYGNHYYEGLKVLEGQRQKRRTVENPLYDRIPGNYSEELVPVLWQMWLRHKREHAPTPYEIEAEEQRVAVIKQKAQMLDVKYALEREQQRVSIPSPQSEQSTATSKAEAPKDEPLTAWPSQDLGPQKFEPESASFKPSRGRR
ncbi:hypothetical protein GQ42DRAFT_50458 [Ramicandelaber brevisporus]|nr:hypothetical protein GQ42DRAFT_50458 [Ramicandelaber brevisporus]